MEILSLICTLEITDHNMAGLIDKLNPINPRNQLTYMAILTLTPRKVRPQHNNMAILRPFTSMR